MCLTSDIHFVIADPGESAEEKWNSKSLRLSFTRKQDVGWHWTLDKWDIVSGYKLLSAWKRGKFNVHVNHLTFNQWVSRIWGDDNQMVTIKSNYSSGGWIQSGLDSGVG